MVAAVLHTTLSSRRGRCGPQLVFILWRFGSLTAGVIASDTALPFRKRRSAQNINTFYFYSVFPFFSLVFFFFFFLEQGLCYVYVSEAHFLAESKDWPCVRFLHLTFNDVDSQRSKGNISRCRWKKCNVYCCTIFSNKRTQNLFVIFFFELLMRFQFCHMPPLLLPVFRFSFLSHRRPLSSARLSLSCPELGQQCQRFF